MAGNEGHTGTHIFPCFASEREMKRERRSETHLHHLDLLHITTSVFFLHK
jgi:hypothetical protein